MSDLESALECLRSFATPPYAERLGGLLQAGKRTTRRKVVDALAHFSGWREECAHRVPSSLQSPAALEEYATKHGAQSTCYVLSEDPDLDDRRLALKEALDQLVGSGMGSLVVLSPAPMALYLGEEQGDVTFLKW
ncbi:hypothetical protein DQ244_18360 [Blastococcus sp. TBT05-19]|uniref:hypothetical protein n=1 Tax=Blastococcus sp. TBT05-19 TaxID=2250581 RepID=UPI000DEBB932|nr:hypothetical protein [Blastococcus sp. TBT05-19]RBY87272.1 hypothetical protein DQ244_18360 [Blastococcus sp. TBT05-19]